MTILLAGLSCDLQLKAHLSQYFNHIWWKKIYELVTNSLSMDCNYSYLITSSLCYLAVCVFVCLAAVSLETQCINDIHMYWDILSAHVWDISSIYYDIWCNVLDKNADGFKNTPETFDSFNDLLTLTFFPHHGFSWYQ